MVMAASEHLTRQQLWERWWIEFVWKFHSGTIPEWELTQPQPPAPDIVLVGPGRRIGIEISQIVPRSFGRRPDTEIQAAQHRAVRAAQRSFSGYYGDRIFANFSFASGLLPPQGQLVKAMVELVAKHRPESDGEFVALAGSRAAAKLLPNWLRGLSIFPQIGYVPVHWIGQSVWSTSVLRREQVEERIQEKSLRLSGYRAFVDEVWLMLVCDEASISAGVSIPHEAQSWRFGHSFDCVLLAARQEVLRF